jgi:hypothetical protein
VQSAATFKAGTAVQQYSIWNAAYVASYSISHQTWREGEPQTVSIIRQGKADKVSLDLEMEVLMLDNCRSIIFQSQKNFNFCQARYLL